MCGLKIGMLLTAALNFTMTFNPTGQTGLENPMQNPLDPFLYPLDDLGTVYRPGSTRIKIWAPTAQSVRLVLFPDPAGEPMSTLRMLRDSDGVWSITLPGDQDGRYYLFKIDHTNAGMDNPTVYHVNDPYARGCSANSGRSLIYDPRKTDPVDWHLDRFVSLDAHVDAVIYELHLRDFTVHPTSGVPDGLRGKYLGLVEPGTRNPQGEATGLDHLKALGVTHVQILPTFDYAFGDETQSVEAYSWYNWGYDPVLYNTPEGSYATNPDTTARQKEFKRLVKVLHDNGIGVIFDAVYNHTAATGSHPASIFDKVVPRYFYRFDDKGQYADSTWCGNELASEKPMVRKFIVDSIKYWMTEYHIDGFRFDLMGILDRETMLEVHREAKRINPDALIYGEGWQMERVLPPDRMMTQAFVRGTGIAAFNDGIRDNIKGSVHKVEATGFVQGDAPQGGWEDFLLNIKGQSTDGGIDVDSPNETINYASAHDDHCLWDKLSLSLPGTAKELRVRMAKLAMGIVLTSQGVPFLHAGDEILRSKNGVKNSYNSNEPNVNPIDWRQKSEYREVVEYVKGLIALRKAHPAFRMRDKSMVDGSFHALKKVPAKVIAFILAEHANGDSWRRILVAYNGNQAPVDLNVSGRWTLVADADNAGLDPLSGFKDAVRIEACSLIIAHSNGAPNVE